MDMDMGNSEMEKENEKDDGIVTVATDNDVDVDDDESTRETLKPWSDRWKNKRIGFHLKEVNPVLVQYASDLLQLLPSSLSSSLSSNRNTCKASGENDENTWKQVREGGASVGIYPK